MYVLNLVISFIMDELGFTLTGFIVCYLLIYMVGIVYAVCEWRRWKLAGWVVPLAVFMPVVAPFRWWRMPFVPNCGPAVSIGVSYG